MSKLMFGCLLAFALVLNVQAQTNATTNDTPKSILEDWSQGLGSVSNWTVVAYGTYAPKRPQEVGGGGLVAYNVNPYLAAGVGLDYLGSLRMTSGNVQLKVPITVAGITVTPFGVAGIGVPIGGAGSDNGSAAVIAGGGADVRLFRFATGDVAIGYAAVHWSGAGAWDGLNHEFFLAMHLHF